MRKGEKNIMFHTYSDKELDSLINALFPVKTLGTTCAVQSSRYNLAVENGNYVITMPLIGVVKGDLTVEVQENKLSIKAKPSVKSAWSHEVNEAVTLFKDCDATRIDAKLENGLLTVTIPKIVPEKRTVAVKVN
jgi:HSP20 family molecular chaperone IbpA